MKNDPAPVLVLEFADGDSGIDPTSLVVLLDGEVLGNCQVGPASAACPTEALAPGSHLATAQIADHRANRADISLDFVVVFPLEIAILAPAPESTLTVPVVRVTGTVSPSARSVRINGIEANVAGGSFTIESFGLHNGLNNLVAVAEDEHGNIGAAIVRVTADTSPPYISISWPVDGESLTEVTVDVAGKVNDLTLGTVSGAEISVTVNGVAAEIGHRSFLARGVALAPGNNTIAAVATDRAGNQSRIEISVDRDDRVGFARLRKTSGDLQSAPIFSTLPQPLVVTATDGAGLPRVGIQVVFRVVEGNGTLAGGVRAVVATTDAHGEASTSWTIGGRAGEGVNRLRVSAVGIVGEVVFSSRALAESPAAIDVASGDVQNGIVGAELWQPLVAVVTDVGHNPLPDVAVTFRVARGGGSFAGASQTVVSTDASGLARTWLTLGSSPGLDNNLVEATFPGQATLPAGFRSSAYPAGIPSETRLTGVVLDNQGEPVPGVTLRLRASLLSARSEEQGQFRLAGVPVGQVFLIADATTATRPGSWANLEFELFALPGVENQLPRPIYILPLDLAHGALVDETHGGSVTLPDVPGFALDVEPGSVTFPGGGRSGVISVTAVHADRVPMTPGAGMQPRLIVTIQPVGARFDPPARLTLPNVDGLPAGTVTELFSFDHDIGAFVSIGTGTVSEDGLAVTSDPGFGVVEAGWHCGAPPAGSGAGATLSVRITPVQPRPIVVCAPQPNAPDPHANTTRELVAEGAPPIDSEYIWIGSGPITLNPSGSNLCRDQSSCATTVTGVRPGVTRVTAMIRCTTTGAIAQELAEVQVPGVEVTGVDICNNQIGVRLVPDQAQGTLILRARSAAGAATEFFRAQRRGGSYQEHFDFARVPVRREITEVEAEWQVGKCQPTDRTAAHFLSLGTIRHTQYNCPSESDPTCSGGGTVPVCFSDASCTYTGPNNLASTFVSQVTSTINGTGCGVSTSHGNVQMEFFCLRGHAPPAACQGLQVLRTVGAFQPHCGGSLGADTVAVHDSYLNGLLPCGTNICIMTGAVGITKTVTDRCPACGLSRIDNYSTSGACGINDLSPGAVTLRLYN